MGSFRIRKDRAMNEEALGIPGTGIEYLKLAPEKDNLVNRIGEFEEIRNFLVEVAQSNLLPEFQGNSKAIQFINYGDTEMVYVLSVGERKYTMLLGQPATQFGTVKQEYENLKMLGRNHPQEVVVPMQCFTSQNGRHELYVTPYLHQARCVGIETTQWGAWVPEPFYRFEDFSQEERSVINSSMIALLINFFDTKNNLGIGACHLGGGDFVLEKGYENEPVTHENILKRIKLIAARELLPMSLDEYVKRIQDEFSQRTYYRSEEERDKSILINHKLKTPMTQEEIQSGIELGYALRERQKEQEEK